MNRLILGALVALGLFASAEAQTLGGGTALIAPPILHTAAGTYTDIMPVWAHRLWVREIGPGQPGCGGNTNSGAGGAAGGGGAGGDLIGPVIVAITPGSTITSVVGAGGSETAVGAVGNAGGPTSVSGALENVPPTRVGVACTAGGILVGGSGGASLLNLGGGIPGAAGGSGGAGGATGGSVVFQGIFAHSGSGGGGGAGSTSSSGGGGARSMYGPFNISGGANVGGGAGGSSTDGVGGIGGATNTAGTSCVAGNSGGAGGGGGGGTTAGGGGAGCDGKVELVPLP